MKKNKLQCFLVFIFMFLMFKLNAQTLTTGFTSLNQFGTLQIAEKVNLEAKKIGKNASVAVLDASGNVLLLLKGMV